MKIRIRYIMVSVMFIMSIMLWGCSGKSTVTDAPPTTQGGQAVENQQGVIDDKKEDKFKVEEKQDDMDKIEKQSEQTAVGYKKDNEKVESQKSTAEPSQTNKPAPVTTKKPEQTAAPKPTSTLNTSPAKPKLFVEEIKGVKNSEQVIVVTTSSYSAVSAKIEVFEKTGGEWKAVFLPINAVVGKNGFALSKKEGDKKTPVGIYTLTNAFGKYGNPGTKLSYRQTTTNDFWVDDPKSSLYNTWQTGSADGRWSSAETLRRSDNLYDYAVVVNYNTSKVPYKGSAIFMHIWRGSGTGTAGCIAMSQSDLLKIMKWINPSKKPIIIQGPRSVVVGM